jgi:hypothetical protein
MVGATSERHALNTTTIIGLFDNPEKAALAVDDLLTRNVSADDISVVASESISKEAFAIDTHTKMPEGAAIGATAGGGIGAVVAGFTAVGTIGTGGLGLIAAGPVVAALAGAGAGAAGGSIVGALTGLGFSEHEAKHVEDAVEKGSALVGVETNAIDKDDVKTIFKSHDVDKIVKD